MKLVKFTSSSGDAAKDEHDLWINPDQVVFVEADFFGDALTTIVMSSMESPLVSVKEDLLTVVRTLTESSFKE